MRTEENDKDRKWNRDLRVMSGFSILLFWVSPRLSLFFLFSLINKTDYDVTIGSSFTKEQSLFS